MEFLKRRGLIDGSITLKGRAASEIRTVNEVLVIELIFYNEFADFDSSELISVFSSMVHESAGVDFEDLELAEHLKEKVYVVDALYNKLSEEMFEMEIPKMEPLNFGMVGAVYDWCEGKSLGNIVALHNVQEGTFVRLILRLEECCREMINVAVLIGGDELEQKFKEASQKLKRGIVFMPSLYI